MSLLIRMWEWFFELPWNAAKAGPASDDGCLTAEKKYPSLYYLCGCYLHQDFNIVHGSVNRAIYECLWDLTFEGRAKLKEEIDRILAANPKKVELDTLLFRDIVSFYDYEYDWPTPHEWLGRVRDMAAAVDAVEREVMRL